MMDVKDVSGIWTLTKPSRELRAKQYNLNKKDAQPTEESGTHWSGEVGPQTLQIAFAPYFNPNYPLEQVNIGVLECYPFGGRTHPFCTTIPFTWTLNSINRLDSNLFTPISEPIEGAHAWVDISHVAVPDYSVTERFYFCRIGNRIRMQQKNKGLLTEWERYESDCQ